MGGRGANSGIIHINSRLSYHGKPNIVSTVSAAGLNKRQQRLLDNLKKKGDYVSIRKNDVSMKDLSALTAKENVEFSMWTLGSNRIIVRGNANNSNPNKEVSNKILTYHYKLSGHTHIGLFNDNLLESPGDIQTLSFLKQNKSVIYNSSGRYKIFTRW